jgi:23S rRNA (guanosine2251-2'-O)-methyltransferase
VLFGIHAVREALRASSRPIQRLLVSGDTRRYGDILRLAREAHVPVHFEPRPALDRLAPPAKHQGLVAIAAVRSYADVTDLIAGLQRAAAPALLVVLDGVEDPHNLGAIVRSAEGAGAHGIVVPERRAAGLSPVVAKVSAGALEHVPVARATNLNRVLEMLKAAGLWVYGLSAGTSMPYTALDFRQPVALVFGGEGVGLRPSLREKCDALASIPMQGRIESLNVSAAAAVVLFEAVRQRASSSDPVTAAG